jgi:hypothetical protein
MLSSNSLSSPFWIAPSRPRPQARIQVQGEDQGEWLWEFVEPKGVVHRPRAEGEVHLLLIGPPAHRTLEM